MKDKLYFGFYRKLNNKWFAILLSNIAYVMLQGYYTVAKHLMRKKPAISTEDAYDLIVRAHDNPKVSFQVKKQNRKDAVDVSIIIPVYNVEKYLKECLDSVFLQKTKYKYEIIVVNDGSTDSSLEILELYKEKKNYHIINRENGGLSAARNSGIDAAVGKYYLFVDSDDVITDDYVEVLMEAARQENADIVQCRYYSFAEGSNKKYTSQEEAGSYTKGHIPVEKYPGFAWGKLYASYLFHNVRFPEGYWFEDTVVQYILFGQCGKFVCIEKEGYGYRRNPNSISFAAKKNLKVLDTYWITKEMTDLAVQMGNIDREYLYKLTLRQYSLIMYNRLHWIDEELLQAVFILVCEEVKKLKTTETKMTGIYSDLERAFETGNISLWKLCSIII